MADDWEDWEDESFAPAPLAGAANGKFETVGQAVLAKVAQPDASKFAGEDEEEEEPAWKGSVPQPAQPKERPAAKRYEDRDGAGASRVDDTPLDDPVAEKLRQQRLIEESDFAATRELFGGDMPRLETLVPKSAKDFEDYAKVLALQYLLPHAKSTHYKMLLKTVLKHALAPISLQETKDLESCLAGIRADKVKEDNAAKAGKKAGGKKKTLNVGKSGGSAGLEDYQFDAPLDDEYDFM